MHNLISPQVAASLGETNPPPGIDSTLAERGSRYGSFVEHAAISQLLSISLLTHAKTNNVYLTPSQREALHMICHKLGRIVNGDPNYDDSWRDIAGYATLIVKELNKQPT